LILALGRETALAGAAAPGAVLTFFASVFSREIIPSGQSRVQIPQPVHFSKSTPGLKVRQAPVLFLIVELGLTDIGSFINNLMNAV
jgi:hypothetical protein